MIISTIFRITAFIFIASIILIACSDHYYAVQPVTPASSYPSAIERAQKKHRYMTLQSGINLYTITSVDLDKAKQEMTVILDKVDSTLLFNGNNPDNNSKSKKGQKSQLHLYLVDSTSYTFDEPHTIPLNKLSRVELVD